jgi:hypothetical protein
MYFKIKNIHSLLYSSERLDGEFDSNRCDNDDTSVIASVSALNIFLSTVLITFAERIINMMTRRKVAQCDY